MVRIAGDCEILVEDGPRFIREAATVRRASKETLGDLAGTSSADARNARDGQDVLDEGFRGLGRLTFDRRQQARMANLAMAVGFAQAVEPVARHDGANDASLDGRRDFQRIDQPVEQTHIAEFHNRRRCHPDMIEAFQSKGENFRVGRRCIGSTDGFEARLHELAAFAGPHPENRTAIAIACGLRSMGVQVLEADRNVYSGRRQNSEPAASCVTNMRRRMSSPDKSTNTSAGCSTAGSTRA